MLFIDETVIKVIDLYISYRDPNVIFILEYKIRFNVVRGGGKIKLFSKKLIKLLVACRKTTFSWKVHYI